MGESLPYVEKALMIETIHMNNTHVGTVVECMTLDMEYEGAKFNLHQNRNTYYLSSSDEMVDFDAMLIRFATPGVPLPISDGFVATYLDGAEKKPLPCPNKEISLTPLPPPPSYDPHR